MNLNINAIETCKDIPECMMMEEIRHATQGRMSPNGIGMYVIKWLVINQSYVKKNYNLTGHFVIILWWLMVKWWKVEEV